MEVSIHLKTFWALAIGLVGFGGAWGLGFPAPSLTGAALMVSIAGVAGMRLDVSPMVRNIAFTIIGMSMGTGVTPEFIDSARQWPVTILALSVGIVAIFAACAVLLQRVWKYDVGTAVLASTPGHLSYILGLSTQTGGDIATVSIIQSIRVLALTLVVPFAVALSGMLPEIPNTPPASMGLIALAISFVLAGIIGAALGWLNVPAALLLGGMIVSTLTHLTGTIEGIVPGWLAQPAFIVLGTLIGTRFSGVTFAMLRKSVSAGLSVTLVASIVTIVSAYLTSLVVPIDLVQLLIAFAPGGVEAMAAMAVIMQVDPTFVAAHHVIRLTILTILAPYILYRATRT